MNISISLLIPTLGGRQPEFERLLGSLAAQSYQNLELVVVSQDQHEAVAEQCAQFNGTLKIKHLKSDIKGLSVARNAGLPSCSGDVVVLSDDDCWYPTEAMETIAKVFAACPQTDVLLTQIFDPETRVPYKSYSSDARTIKTPVELLSRSSVELAFRKDDQIRFDESFGLGAVYSSGEEADFLLKYLRAGKCIIYRPVVTVYHLKKVGKRSARQIEAKGAFYAKNFGFAVANAVLLRDLIKKRENNYKPFWKGYFDYKKRRHQ